MLLHCEVKIDKKLDKLRRQDSMHLEMNGKQLKLTLSYQLVEIAISSTMKVYQLFNKSQEKHNPALCCY